MTERGADAAAGFARGSLSGRTALVTGGASGIGRATAIRLGWLGAAVAVVDIDGEGARAVAAEVTEAGGRALDVGFDLADIDAIDGLVDRIEHDLGPVTILVNDAALIAGRRLLETDLDLWQRSLDVNLTAPFLLTLAVGHRMSRHGTGGTIVNLSSSSAFRAVNTSGVYGVTKAGINALTRAAAWELGPFGVTVNSVAPGVTRTPVTAAGIGGDDALDEAVRSGPLANLLGRVSEPGDIANVIAFLCLPASRQVTGQVIQVSAGAVVAAG